MFGRRFTISTPGRVGISRRVMLILNTPKVVVFTRSFVAAETFPCHDEARYARTAMSGMRQGPTHYTISVNRV